MWRYGPVLAVVALLVVVGCEEKKVPPVPPSPVTEAASDTEILDSIAKTAEKGAAFLVSKQQIDGSFGGPPTFTTGITALAVCALSNNKEAKEKYKDAIEKGCKFLISKQQADGSVFDGQGLTVYKTSVAIMALCSADRTAYTEAIKKAQDYIVKSQYWSGINASDVKYGGWGYDEKNKMPAADLSNTQFALEGLESSALPKDNPVWERAVKFASRSQQSTETNDLAGKIKGVKIGNDGGFIYGPADTRALKKEDLPKDEEGNIIFTSYASMTYAGFKSLLYANISRTDPRVQAAWQWIRGNYGLDENYGMGTRQEPATTKQGLYYFYRAFGKALLAWGERLIVDTKGVKHDWCKELAAKLDSLQRPDGSWINKADRWGESIPELATSFALDALNTAKMQVEKTAK